MTPSVSARLGITGTGANDVWVVGTGWSDGAAVQHWDGVTWASVDSRPVSDAQCAWTSPEGEVWIGTVSDAYRRVGTEWVEARPCVGAVAAIGGTSKADVWVGGTQGLAHWNGTAWTEVASNPVLSLWASARDDVWVHFHSDELCHWNGTKLRCDYRVRSYEGGFWGSAPNDVWLASYGGADHWDGVDWTWFGARGSTRNYALWGSGSNDVYMVGEEGGVFHWDGVAWTPVAVDSVRCLLPARRSVWGSGPDDVYIGSDSGAVLHLYR
ncbi:MAG: hypothetical protein QM765_03220 [Myxococcales bacterium]